MSHGLLLALAYTAGLALLFPLRAESTGSALPHYTRREQVSVIASLVATTAHMTLACLVLTFTTVVPIWGALVSVAAFASGLAFWVWARSLIGPLRVLRLPDEVPPRLRRDGPFGVVRNPLYLGLLVMGAAPLVVVPWPLLVGTWLLMAATLAVRAAQEEERLHGQLGAAYAAYCREVPRLIPFLW